jgi:predicted sugar kinase
MSLAAGGRVRTTTGRANNLSEIDRSSQSARLSPFSVEVTSQGGFVYIGQDAFLLKQYNTPLPIHLGQSLVPDGSSVFVAVRDAVRELRDDVEQSIADVQAQLTEQQEEPRVGNYSFREVNGELTVLRNGEAVLSVS